MADKAHIIVVDIGKTLSKVTAWSRSGQMVDRQERRNEPHSLDGILRLDSEGIAAWLLAVLPRYRKHPVEAIVPVAHGAAFAALGDEGLLFAPFDYEQELPSELLGSYRSHRDPFSITGSPALPAGLNLGAQLWWAEFIYPQKMAAARLVPWAQYWAWWFSGVAKSEVSSLGCHTDLWCPERNDFSPMAKLFGWAHKFAPIMTASDVVGTIKPELAHATGLPVDARIYLGVHDSNAALLSARGFPGIRDTDTTVLSTGTWFIGMRLPAVPADTSTIPPDRDCLVNIDTSGKPVPSARFMGGREIESVVEIDTRRVDIKPDQPRLLEAVPALVAAGSMLLPTLAPGCGPFPTSEPRWVNEPGDWHARRAAMCLYAALVADVSLDLIGSHGQLLIEGRFSEAEVFVRALAALRPGTKVFTAKAHNDVSFGALRLIDPALAPQDSLIPVEPLEVDLATYRADWCVRAGVTP